MSFVEKLKNAYAIEAKILTPKEMAERRREENESALRSSRLSSRRSSSPQEKVSPNDVPYLRKVDNVKEANKFQKELKDEKKRKAKIEKDAPKRAAWKAFKDKVEQYSGSLSNDDDTSRLDLEDMISVRINEDGRLMPEADYDKMEEEMEAAERTGPGYVVYAWNDSSGYEYWKGEGRNYIMVTASIKDMKKVDPEKLGNDMADVHAELEHWGNYEGDYVEEAEG